jgi:hypothetical protein
MALKRRGMARSTPGRHGGEKWMDFLPEKFKMLIINVWRPFRAACGAFFLRKKAFPEKNTDKVKKHRKIIKHHKKMIKHHHKTLKNAEKIYFARFTIKHPEHIY